MAAENFVLDDDDEQLPPQASAIPLRHTFEVEYSEPVKLSQHSNKGQADVLEEEDQDIHSFQGYHAPTWKLFLFYFLGIFTFGFTFLLCKWSAKVHIALSLSRCPLDAARFVRVQTLDGQTKLVHVELLGASEDTHQQDTRLFDADKPETLLSGLDSPYQRLIEFRCIRYFYVPSAATFIPVPGTPSSFINQLYQTAQLLPSASSPSAIETPQWQLHDRQLLYGANEMKIPLKSLFGIIYDEMWHPFYVFQYFSIFVWVVGDQYYTYSVCIFLITWFSIITSAAETHTNLRRLADIAEYSCPVEVLREGEWLTMSSTLLVPGDMVAIKPGVLPCDLVLLSGECIADENMLTGESVPVRKVTYSPAADGLTYDADKSAACTLYGGTNICQAKAPRGGAATGAAALSRRPVGMVARTRFYSAKGQLLQSILFPKEHQQAFISDSLKFIAVMLVACLAMFLWSAVTLANVGAPPGRIAWRFFDMITVAVPPALPACLTICTIFAIGRLRDRGVYVTSPERIAMAGHLEVICFDKTGTLTQPGLHLKGILPVAEGMFRDLVVSARQLPALVEQLLATCHGLARMGTTLVGDPLDQKLFEATGWSMIDDSQEPALVDPVLKQQASNLFNFLEDAKRRSGLTFQDDTEHACTWVQPPRSSERYAVLRRFEFTSAAQRSGVVVLTPDGRMRLFVKGSPEMLRGMVAPASVPGDFDKVLGDYTREGLRMLALAAADLTELGRERVMGMNQEEAEAAAPLQLLGLAAMENPLRDDSAEVIMKLQTANIRCAMVTGDHVRTAISVSHHCNLLAETKPVALIDGVAGGLEGGVGGFHVALLQPNGELTTNTTISGVLPQIICGEVECAITGKAFRSMVTAEDTQYLPTVLQRAGVYARMSPDDKRDLMQLLGDGLVSAEARPGMGYFAGFCGDGANDCGALKAAHVGVSLCEAEASVAAPMTSKQQSIACMITVVAEGRCTLMATYQIFQFIIGYALVQAFSTNLMYTFALDMGNYQYLIQDLFFTTVLAGLMGYTAPRKALARERPLKRVMSLPLMMSTVLQLLVVILFQCIALAALQARPGYQASLGTSDLKAVKSPENTVAYLTGLAQYIILAIIFNKGYPHRSPLFTNLSLTASLVVQFAFLLFSLFSVNRFNTKVQELVGTDTTVTMAFRGILLLVWGCNLVAAGLAETLAAPVMLWVVNSMRRGNK